MHGGEEGVLIIGQTLGEFTILDRLGQGGMGEVYLVEDAKLERQVALKILPPDLAADADRLARFQREIKILASLSHPNIVTVHSVHETDDLHFFTMERVSGESLASRLERGPLPLEEMLTVAMPMAEALCAAHERGIVHRDLKPENVMINEDGTVKVLDFGLAKSGPLMTGGDEVQISDERVTDKGTIVGTFLYMSPEQIRGESLDPRSDIFSFGLMIYEMVCGRRPFRGQQPVEILSAILKDEPPPVTWYHPELPNQLARIVRHCLEKDPKKRFQTSRDVCNELADLEIEHLAGKARRVVQKVAAEPAEGVRSSVPRWSLIAVIVAILIFVVFDLERRSKPPPFTGKIESLAVLPLRDLSPGMEDEYFADGMTEALITDLAKTPGLKVIAADSVLRLKDSDLAPAEIARRLGVDALVRGSVTRSSSGVRVSAQLMAAPGGTLFWAESFERSPGEVLALQGDLAAAIAAEIQEQVNPNLRAEPDSERHFDPQAHEAYLRGRYFWNRRSPADLIKAIEQLELAIELDPAFAPPYSALADCYNLLGSVLYAVLPPREVMPKARAASLQALELDSHLAEAHASLGHYLFFYEWDSREAEQRFLRALELNPSYATAHHWYSMLLSLGGRNDEAIVHAEKARELDPLSIVIRLNLGTRYFHARDYKRAEQHYLAALELDPDFQVTHMFLARVYQEMAQSDAAIREIHLAERSGDGNPLVLAFKVYLLGRAGDEAAAHAVLEQLQVLASERYVPAHTFAVAYAGLREKEAMFRELDRAVEERSGMIPFLAVEQLADEYRTDPRMETLVSLTRHDESPSTN